MSTIVTRAGKGSPLTNTEVDSNFTNLNTDKVETLASADGSIVITGTGASIDLSVSQNSPASVLLEQVRNSTGATLTKGTAVYISGATGQLPTVSKALATGDSTSAQTLGLINSDLANNANGYVTIIGLISNINTSAYTDGAQLYLSPTTAGTLTATKPYAPQHLVYVAVVAHAHPTQGKLLVKVQNGYEMDELHNVSAQSPTNGDTLVYNSTTTLWTKTAQSTLSVASAAAVPFSGVTSTPTTLSGYGITDAYSSSNPSGYITSSALSPYLTTATAASTYLPLAGGTLTGKLTLDGRNEVYGVPTNAGTIAGFMGGTSGGTTAARTQSLNTQTLLNIAALGYTGSAWVGGAGLSFVATENQAAGTRGTKAVLSAITTGDSTATTMEFNGSALTINGSTAVTSSNYTTYAPTLTGTGASGTWGINITGNAGSATTAVSTTYLAALGSYVWSASTLPSGYNGGIQSSFVDSSTGWQSYGSVMTMRTYTGSGGGALQMYVPYSPTYGGTGMQVRFGNYDGAANNVWTSWKTLLASDNYNSYAPTLTGTGASGTWGISVTGNAATATDAQNATFTTAGNASWGGRLQIGGNGSASALATVSVVQATDGNLHMDPGSGKATYLNYYNNGIIYLNGTTYYISSNGSNYNGNAATATNSTTTSQTNFSNLTIGGSQVLYAGNYNSYSPTLTGTGASGTWAINISGNAATVGGLTPNQFFNNMGNNHTTYTNFNSVPNFGVYFIQGTTNGPTGIAGHQFYGFNLGLGNDYPLSSYGSQIYYPRRAQNSETYIYVRDMEGSSWTSWVKIRAGYADTAGSAGSVDYNALTNKAGGTGTYTTSGDYRAPIFYDSNDPAYYGDFASTSRFNLAKVNGVYDSSITRGVIPSGAVYTTAAGAPTGAFKIKLPDGSRLLYPMLSFTVELYNYSTGTSRSFRIGGHFSGTSWHNVFAYCLTDYAGSVDVRFGYDAANAMCVWIGEVGSTWSYPQVFVTDFQNGYSAIQESWFSGWSITLVTAFDTVTNGPYTPAMGLNSKNYNSYSPTLTGTGASGTWGISITGNAATVSNIGATQVTNLYSPNAASVVAADSAMPAQGNSLIHTLALGPSGNDGHIIGMTWANTTTVYGAQIWLDTDPTNQMAIRGRSSAGAWTAWAPVLTSVNYNSYSPTLTGGSASGTWGINITGNSATATTLQTNGTVSFTTDNSGFHVIGAESTGSNVRLGAAWNRPGIYNGSGTTAGGLTGSITIGSENSIYFVTQNVERGRFDNSGIGYASASFRAPIFYDSDNTAYFVNPTSNSLLSSLAVDFDFRAAFASGVGGTTFSSSHYSMGKDTANGSWSHPHYSDLIIGYHTGIRLGAAYSGIRFYNNSPTTDANNDGNGDVGEALLMTVGGYVGTANSTDVYVNNNLFAGSSMRAPIFYDSGNTGYYTDPASTSVLNGVTANTLTGPINGMPNDGNAISGMGSATTWDARPQGVFDRYAINWHTGISLSGYPTYGGVRLYSAGYPTQANAVLRLEASSGVYTYGNFTNNTRVDAPIFYDSNDTSYYLDPASTSNLNQVNLQGYLRRNTSAAGYLEGNYPTSVDGSSSACIYTIGGAYQPTSTTMGNMYGIGYTVGNGTSNPGLGMTGWGLYVASGGTSKIFLDSDSGTGIATTSWRAPIFYDRDNTAYYGDFASTTTQYQAIIFGDSSRYSAVSTTVNGSGAGDKLILYGGVSNYDARVLVGTDYDFIFKSQGAPASKGKFTFYSGTGALLALTIDTDQSTISSTSMRAPIFYDSNDTAYYLDPASTSRINRIDFTNLYLASNNAYGFIGTQVFCDTLDSGVAGDQLELNYSRGTFVSIAHDSIRAPLFYDVSNTGYYTDPASTSNLNRISTVRTDNWLYIDSNYGHSVVGVYSSYRYQGVFSMGDSYKLPADGTTTGSLYGMAWSHPNAGGAAGNLTDHGLLIINNGAFRCAISNSIVASANITAYSDERLKTNWRDMPEDYVTRLAQVKVGIYDRIDQEDVTQVGVSAQSFQELLPQAIMTAKDEMQTLSVSYGNAALASAVELAKEVVDLRNRVAHLESLIHNLIGD